MSFFHCLCSVKIMFLGENLIAFVCCLYRFILMGYCSNDQLICTAFFTSCNLCLWQDSKTNKGHSYLEN